MATAEREFSRAFGGSQEKPELSKDYNNAVVTDCKSLESGVSRQCGKAGRISTGV